MMRDLVVVGGGPAGLAAAHEAVHHGASVVVLERLQAVGGLARTIEFQGSRFDIGPHRFFTKNEEVRQLFTGLLGDALVRVRRQTRILSAGTFFDYPLTPLNAMSGISIKQGVAIAGSYASARIRALCSQAPITTFEDWIVARFGRHLYQTFFKCYTEKVWGIPCDQISADWAAQRIKGLSLMTAIRNAVKRDGTKKIKTLADEFIYPRCGAGQVYEAMEAAIMRQGGTIATGTRIKEFRREGTHILAVVADSASGLYDIPGSFFLASLPLTDLIEMIRPEAPTEVLRAARELRYREHIAVNLVVDGCPFPDNWIYVHSPEVRVARIANYRNFSPAMAGSDDVSPLTVEYFASPGDELSRASDAALIELAVRELDRIGIVEPDRLRAGFVVRSEKAYPVMQAGHERHVATIRAWLDRFDNLLPIGRSGMFKYNNQDHAMATGLLAARTALGMARFDPWAINIDAEYSETGRVS